MEGCSTTCRASTSPTGSTTTARPSERSSSAPRASWRGWPRTTRGGRTWRCASDSCAPRPPPSGPPRGRARREYADDEPCEPLAALTAVAHVPDLRLNPLYPLTAHELDTLRREALAR